MVKLFPENMNWKTDILTIPNILSFVRILILPFYLWAIIGATTVSDYYLAGGIIFFSGLTDMIDGWIARTFNQITEIGKLLDPVADKLTQLVLTFSLILLHKEMWVVAIFFVVKEGFMLISGWFLLKKGSKLDGAKWFGKLATAVFYATMFLLLILPDMSKLYANSLIGLTLFTLALSFVLYIREYLQMFKEAKKEGHNQT